MHFLPLGMNNPRPEPQTVESIATRAPAGRAVGGDTATATIESLTHDARGVARVAGKATFIEGALPGEHVRFRYHTRRARYDTGAAVEILEPSRDRVIPPCGYFGVCGGCTLQHMAASAQVHAKARVLAEVLRHLGRVQPQRWLPPIQAGDLGYRRRARLGVRFVEKKGGVLIGFRERRRSYITGLASCLTLDPRLSALLPGLQGAITNLSRPDRIPQVEVSAGDDSCAVVVRHLTPLGADDLAHLRGFAEEHRVGVYLQPGDPRTVRALWPESGTTLTYTLPFDVKLAFGPTDFIQINAAVNRALVNHAVTLLDPQSDERVLDLFCGLGNFTLPLARRAAQVVGCENDPTLVQRARENARANGIGNADFHGLDLYRGAAGGLWAQARYDALLLDPPRAGAMDIIKSIPADGPRRAVYVSCNPATLARDSQYLVHVLGYQMEAVGIADMFPHTSHVESIALYVRA
jgi:23S rRNA (uracil1939-C5)-methyltransferase